MRHPFPEVPMLDIRVASPQQHENLILFPLIARGAPELPYDLLVDALAAGTLSIGELGTGQVPTLVAKNSGERDVLVLYGEQLIGSKQNRITNRSMLLPAGAVTEIPVYCMEQGGWQNVSNQMTTAPQHTLTKVRRRARETEARATASGRPAAIRSLREAQGLVWRDVAETMSKLGAHSSTGALDAAYSANASRIDQWLQVFERIHEQLGFVAFVGAEPLGMDLLGSQGLYTRMHARLLRGYILDAMERTDASNNVEPRGEAAQVYLNHVMAAPRTEAPTAGKGRYCVLTGAVIGGELTDAENTAHLSAFPPPPSTGAPPDDTTLDELFASFRRRRLYASDGGSDSVE
jgi:hypothetical protein